MDQSATDGCSLTATTGCGPLFESRTQCLGCDDRLATLVQFVESVSCQLSAGDATSHTVFSRLLCGTRDHENNNQVSGYDTFLQHLIRPFSWKLGHVSQVKADR